MSLLFVAKYFFYQRVPRRWCHCRQPPDAAAATFVIDDCPDATLPAWAAGRFVPCVDPMPMRCTLQLLQPTVSILRLGPESRMASKRFVKLSSVLSQNVL